MTSEKRKAQQRIYNARYSKKNREKMRIKNRAKKKKEVALGLTRTPERRAKNRIYGLRSYYTHKWQSKIRSLHRNKAHQKLIVKEKCEKCDSKSRLQIHHLKYTIKPQVRILCQTHHMMFHRRPVMKETKV